ncbi:SDR family oxidoreductase [Fulvivirga sedimenti]|uniref:SDR family oxidoreductase n=1 Tax=Fulvivirga sedimenti TaxID=2879465 RepID=A0A9X1HYA9_9BACT|nr:SDR family oxidoreductase [Fulvivirga sedimenti]MCA6078772.1 SDR family oxidoreductase [Fulvivirga sedimenti]
MKSVLLLGAMSDVGQALANQYVNDGWDVWLAARNLEKLDLLRNDIRIRTNKDCSCFLFDALDFESHQTFFSSLPGCPDVVILIFGLLGDQEKAARNWDQSKAILETNYTGAVSILNIVAAAMADRGSGTIAGISSVAGDRGRKSNYLYGSAKAGFTAYLSGLRNDLFSKGVHVVTVKPGFMNTKMTENLDLPGPLTAEPDQVAKKIQQAIKKKKNTVYIKGIWRWIMLIIVLIPEFVFKRMKL